MIARRLKAALATATLFLLVACGDGSPSTQASAPASSIVLNRGNGGEPNSLDPAFIGANLETNIVGDLLTGLTTLDAAARPIPGAADHWETTAVHELRAHVESLAAHLADPSGTP